ncbi:MAG: LytTR family transcriptional regulator DNA-binding domain-containing protein, partial [Clostridia bacterium]|nr:LytTR family transcriptional regulator DNA-binding domain-containing protein [Clostridia bacterium]
LKLYEFEELTYGTHFFRATKSTVINADRITCVSPALYGRFTATLDNGEKVMVSRSYVSSLKRIMGL